jgi:hypothetical protein
MDEPTARRIAERERVRHEVPSGHALRGAERRIIELDVGQERVRDVLVWVVRFQAGIAWAELAVEDGSGDVVRVQKSR